MPSNVENGAPGPPHPGSRPWLSQATALLGFLAVSWMVSALGSLPIRLNADGWYAAAEKAPWTPPGWMFAAVWLPLYAPGWMFAAVWLPLYAAMAVAAWLVWRQFPRSAALRLYGIQLALNLAWPVMFFGMYPMLGTAALWLAFAILAALAAAVTLTVLRFGPISRAAGLLMLPYVSWLVFSGSLNLYAALHN